MLHISPDFEQHNTNQDLRVLRGDISQEIELDRPPLWSSAQSSWQQIQRSQIFWEVVSTERGPLSLKRIFEALLDSKVAAPV
jgi:hypothetical protein